MSISSKIQVLLQLSPFFVSFELLVAAGVLDLPIRQCTESDLAKPEKS